MTWNDHKAIYLQIVDRVVEDILKGTLKTGDRALSVRDLAAEVQVNPNTVVRSYGLLEQEGILYNQRGLGFFIAENASAKARDFKKKEFIESTLPDVFKTIKLLGISMEELNLLYQQFENLKP
jgi:DNA-binding transcriptional regulator YhcF (GntR family)